jgi:UDP-galactopyranose mutase
VEINERELFHKVIQDCGKQSQKIKAIEELAELIQAIAKGTNLSNVAEEMADVSIMLDQLKMIYDNAKEVAGWREYKLGKLNYRLLKFETQIEIENGEYQEEGSNVNNV